MPSSEQLQIGDIRRVLTYNQYAFYGQDDWRIIPRLTLNFGLRYELTTAIRDANNQLGNEERHGAALKDRGILFAPDYVINAGGLINVANELEGYTQTRALQQAAGIYDALKRILILAQEKEPPVLTPKPPRSIIDPKKGFRWGTVFWSAATGLVTLAFWLWVSKLIEDLFAQSQTLGTIGAILAALAGGSLAIIVGREAFGLIRLARIEQLHARAARVGRPVQTLAAVSAIGAASRPLRLRPAPPPRDPVP